MKCEICNQMEHKYTCPACSIKTCSLKCCKQHKTDNNCTGMRDKTKYIKLDHFNERELLNDYRFLEEQQRVVESTQRDLLKRRYDITSSMDYLRKLAYKQSSIIVRFMPRHSTKRLANKTRFDKTTKLISWHLEFKFHTNNKQQQQQTFYFKDRLVSSKELIKNILNEFYNEYEYSYFSNEQLLNEYKNEFDKLKQQQQQQQEDTSNNCELNVLFEVRNFKLKRKFYVKFDFNKTLEDNLNRKTIVEYPTIIIVLNKDLNKYNVEDEPKLVANNNNNNNSNLNNNSNNNDNVCSSQIKSNEQDEEEKEEGECDDEDVDGDVDRNSDKNGPTCNANIVNNNDNNTNSNNNSKNDNDNKNKVKNDEGDDYDDVNDVPDEIFNEGYYDDDDDDDGDGGLDDYSSGSNNKKQKLCFNQDHFEFEFFSDKNINLSKLTNNNNNTENNNNGFDINIEKIE